jgi:hypothetical protein
MGRKILWLAFLCSVSLWLAACGNQAAVVGIDQSGGEVGPQAIDNATQIVKFDPASIPLDGRDPVRGSCGALTAVPGTYYCILDGGGTAAPCFELGGERLLCGPNPVTGSYQALVAPDAPLPEVLPPPPDQAVEFFVELEGDIRTCVIRTGVEPVIIAGVAALYDCDAPYTFLLGIDKFRTPIWEAALYTLDPATGESPSGKVPIDVIRAWIP